MFSLAFKNAILMILIILIIHFLIKNYLKIANNKPTVVSEEEYFRVVPDEAEIIDAMNTNVCNDNNFSFNANDAISSIVTKENLNKADVDKDEDDLYKYISSNKPLSQDNIVVDHNQTTQKNVSPSNNDMSQLGTFSKHGYSSFGSPLHIEKSI